MRLALVLLLLSLCFPARAQVPDDLIPTGNWWRNTATLDLDFVHDRYWLNGTQYSGIASFISGAGATFSRNSVATYFDTTGTLQTASANVPRLDYGSSGGPYPAGILIEESRTNSIRNSTLQGAVAGTPGTPPTDWSISATPGLSSQILGTFTVNGITILRVRFFGTTTAASASRIDYDTGSVLTGLGTSQPYTQSVYLAVSAGALPAGASLTHWGRIYDSTNANVADNQPRISASGVLTRQTDTQTTPASGSTPFHNSGVAVLLYPTQGVTVDITLDIGAPQIELGAFPTSYIPTSGSAVTRAADVFTLPTTATGTNGAWYMAGIGTLLANGTMPYIDTAGFHRFSQLDDGTGSNSVLISESVGVGKIVVVNSGSQTYSANTVAGGVANLLQKGAVSYGAGNIYAAINGSSFYVGGASAIPALSMLYVGSGAGNYFFDGWVNRVVYFPTQQPNYSLPDYTQ